MATQKFMGKHKLLQRLTAQTGSKGMARAILIKRGQMTPEGVLTSEGKARDAMTAASRAKDRAAKAANRSPDAFVYNPKTNTAKLKKR
jgi:hypothetical protein